MKTIDRGSVNFHTYISDIGACAHLRVIFPSLMLNQFMTKNLMFRSSYSMFYTSSLDFYKNQTFIKFQRSATKEQLNYIKHVKNLRAIARNEFGILYDTDDLLFGKKIPDYNISKKFYVENFDNIKRILREVDGVIVSTNRLKQEIKNYCKTVEVIENRLPGFLWDQKHPEQRIKENESENRKPRILWAGSVSHFSGNDLGDFSRELIDFIIKTRKKYTWVFFGCWPEELTNYIEIEKFHWAKIVEYGRFLDVLSPDIGIAPLQKNQFNECKSNIKGLEFCSLGIPGVYSNLEPYKDFTLISDSTEEFISNIEKLCSDKQYRIDVFNKDFEKHKDNLYITEEYLKEYVAKHLSIYGYSLNFD